MCRLNDDRNIRALFERALSSLPPEGSIEVQYLEMYFATGLSCLMMNFLTFGFFYDIAILMLKFRISCFVKVWNKFSQFEQTYGDLASMLKVVYPSEQAMLHYI